MLLLTPSHSYQLASKLQERLDEMGKDLTSMIEEINDASSTLSKNNNADDPVRYFSFPI
jgi:nuclear pore complex protein Nup62